MTRSAGAARFTLISAFALAGLGIGLLAGHSPLAAIASVGGIGFIAAILWNIVTGLSIFTLMIFFGQLGGASLVKAAGLLLVLAWFTSLLQHDRAVPFMPRERPLLAYTAGLFTAWSAFSILWAADGSVASSTAFRLLLNVLLFLIVFSVLTDKDAVRTILVAYVAGAALTCLYGVASGTTQADNPASGRLSGGIGDPNELAALILPALVFAVFLLPLFTRLVARAFLLGACLLFVTTIVLTQSRGGIVALGVAILAAIAFGGPLRARIAAAAMALGAVVVVVFVFVVPPTSLGRISSFGGGTGRLDLWKVATGVISDHPLVGVGAGNFQVVEQRYAASVGNLPRVDLVLDTHKVVHNTYLNILTDMGLVGLLLFAGLVLALLRSLVQSIRRFEQAGEHELALFGRATLVGTIGMLAAFTFISAQYEKQLWLVLGVAAALSSARLLAHRALVEGGGEPSLARLFPLPTQREAGPGWSPDATPR